VTELGSFSVWHWLVVLAVVVLLFGRGKIPELMGDVAKGIKSFKNGMKDDEKQSAETTAKGQPLDERPSPALANLEGRS
jgi:sec-independent protein translocase protein TatA